MSDLIVSELSKSFPTRDEPLEVLKCVSVELAAGDSAAIVGPSGSGKTTLLHILGTLDEPTAGTVTLSGEVPFSMDDARLATFRREKIGFVFQEHHLLGQCTALENVLIPTLAGGGAVQESARRAEMLLDRVGMANRYHHRPAELSGGERQRVAIARSLIHRPALLLADEPTGNLDRSTAADIATLLLEIQQQESAMLVVVTHSSQLASRMARQFELDGGVLAEMEQT